MPSGPKKRRAVRRKMKDEANINEHNATKSEEMTGIIGHTSVEGYNSSIKTVAADDLLVPANNISKGTGNIHNEVDQEDVILGSKQIEEKAMASVNEYTSDSPIVSGLNKSYEAMLSKEKVCIDNKPVQESLMESREADLSEEENEAAVLAEDIKMAQDVLMENEEAALYNVVVHTDYSITSPYDEFVSKEIKNNENTSDSSMVIFSAMKEDEKDSPSVYQEAEALASSIAMDFVAKENEYNILQTSEAVTSSEQIHYACPLHSRSGCIFCHWFGGQSDGEYSSEDKNASYKGMNSKMLLEHVKKTVEAELYAADKVVFLLRNFLDDLNAINLQMDHYFK